MNKGYKQIWQYVDASDAECRGIFLKYADFGGTDLSYTFHKLDNEGKPIVYKNGGICINVINGSRLKLAERIGAMPQGEYEAHLVPQS